MDESEGVLGAGEGWCRSSHRNKDRTEVRNESDTTDNCLYTSNRNTKGTYI